MLWFNKEKRKKMEFIQNYVPTSKAQLIQVAMMYNKGDLEKAQEMFDFYNKNLKLPDFDPVQPTFMQQVKEGAGGLFSWVKENGNDLVSGLQFVQDMIRNKGIIPAGEAVGAAAEETEELPPINE